MTGGAKRLTSGIVEDKEYRWPRIDESAFRRTGRYGPALALTAKLLASPSTERLHEIYLKRCLESGSTLPAATYEQARALHAAELPWILVVESENARRRLTGPPDHRSVHRKYQSEAVGDARRIKALLSDLKRFDAKHAYLLRNSFGRALEDFLSEETVHRRKHPDPNTKKGYRWVATSGPEIRRAEFQFAGKLAFFNFDHFLDSWTREIDFVFQRWPLHWMEFGALRFDAAVKPSSAVKMDVAQLGLIAHLTSRLRDFTAGYGLWIYGTGQPIPTHGRPCWEIVAEFVNCALDLANPLTGETARRVWQKFASKHKVTMQGWPNPAKSEPQVQKS